MKKWGEEGEEEKGGGKKEPPPKKHQNLGEKLRRITSKKGGQLTPVQTSNFGVQDRDLVVTEKNPGFSLTVCLPTDTSARNLAATVWELHQYNLPFVKMHNSGGNRRNHRYLQLNNHHHHHHHRHHLLEDNPDHTPASPDLVKLHY